MKKVQLRIPEPCHEDWAQMTPVERGRFCATCEKVVTDYTQWSSVQITEALREGQLGCGRFRPDQLEQSYVLTPHDRHWRRAASLLFPLLMGGASLAGQANMAPEILIEQTIQHNIPKNDAQTDKGRVTDTYGQPLANVNITVKGKTGGTSTDENGFYSLPGYNDNDVVVFSHIGFETYQIKLKILRSRDTPEIMLMEMPHQIAPLEITHYQSTLGKSVVGLIYITESERKAKDLRLPEVYSPPIKVYPNPFQSQLTIHFQAAEADDMLIQLMTTTGQILESLSYTATPGANQAGWSPSTHQLSAGLYLLRVVGQKGYQETINIIYQP